MRGSPASKSPMCRVTPDRWREVELDATSLGLQLAWAAALALVILIAAGALVWMQ